MSFVTVLGDPDKLCSFLNNLITSGGSKIDIVKKTQNNATYLVGYTGLGLLLQEDGCYLLLESGDRIIL